MSFAHVFRPCLSPSFWRQQIPGGLRRWLQKPAVSSAEGSIPTSTFYRRYHSLEAILLSLSNKPAHQRQLTEHLQANYGHATKDQALTAKRQADLPKVQAVVFESLKKVFRLIKPVGRPTNQGSEAAVIDSRSS